AGVGAGVAVGGGGGDAGAAGADTASRFNPGTAVADTPGPPTVGASGMSVARVGRSLCESDSVLKGFTGILAGAGLVSSGAGVSAGTSGNLPFAASGLAWGAWRIGGGLGAERSRLTSIRQRRGPTAQSAEGSGADLRWIGARHFHTKAHIG